MKIRWKEKGYLTVEASLIISMAVIVTGIMISLCIHVYQRCWYTQAACETVLTGSSRGILAGSDPLEKAKEKWSDLQQGFYPEPERFAFATEGDDENIRHKITGNTSVWGKISMKIETEASQKMIRPVKFIRKIKALTG